MDFQEFFYLAASVAFVLLSIFLIVAFFIVFYIKKIIFKSLRNVDFLARDLSSNVASLAKGWGSITLAGMAFKLLRGFLRR